MGLPREDSTLGGTSSNLQPCDSGGEEKKKEVTCIEKLMTP
jgi:hypothetical protein